MTSNYNRWNEKEAQLIKEVRRRLERDFNDRPQFPEVVGDRRIIRFLRAFNHNIDKACINMSAFLKWRKENNIDNIRQEIVYGGRNDPRLFPKAYIILSKAPQIVLTPKVKDTKGNPVSYETFDFSPTEVINMIEIEDYITFLIYTLEFKMLILEQLSHEKEKEIIEEIIQHGDQLSSDFDGYGVVMQHSILRNLEGVGLDHIGLDGRKIIAAGISVSEKNYPELLCKTWLVNAPWLFTWLWYFIKGLLDPRTIAKIDIIGANFLPNLLQEFPIEKLPVQLGGELEVDNEPFPFDTSEGGPLWYEGAPTPTSTPVAATGTTAVTTTTRTTLRDSYVGNTIKIEDAVVAPSLAKPTENVS